MFHKGLNKEVLIEASKELVEENGIAAFSMRALAEKLGVKTASLYAHVVHGGWLVRTARPEGGTACRH